MILSDRENKLAVQRDEVGITPRPAAGSFSSTVIDLTLHQEIAFWTPQQGQRPEPWVVYPAQPDHDVESLMGAHGTTLLIPAEGFHLNPGDLSWAGQEN